MADGTWRGTWTDEEWAGMLRDAEAEVESLRADRDRLAGEVADALWRGFKAGWNESGEGANSEHPGRSEDELREMFKENFAAPALSDSKEAKG